MYGGANWQQFACQRLRPEISYFRSGFTVSDDREAALIKALHHLPRPMILYVTKVVEAKRLHRVLVETGFAETECFHGDTSGSDRRRLLQAWRGDKIEIMVATSAFGMGVDKADVRAVVHACYPENVSRYYQGGRARWPRRREVNCALDAGNTEGSECRHERAVPGCWALNSSHCAGRPMLSAERNEVDGVLQHTDQCEAPAIDGRAHLR